MFMIRFESIRRVYPNGLTDVNYHNEDIPQQEWHPAIVELIDLIKDDTPRWGIIFQNFLTALKSSVFYPVMTSFSDWKEAHSSAIITFNPQSGAILDFYRAVASLEAGERIYDTKARSSRWLFGHQMKRVSGYSNEKLLEMFFEFSLTGGAIPLSHWETNKGYGEKIKLFCSDYSKYLKIAYLMPPSWYIQDKIGQNSWLKLLIESGILKDGLLKTHRGIRCIAKDGHECNSLAELEIDNWLYLNKLEHEKEPCYPYHKKYNPNSRLRADFRVGQLFIEYAGLMNDPKYANKINLKKALAAELDMRLVILKPRDMKDIGQAFEAINSKV